MRDDVDSVNGDEYEDDHNINNIFSGKTRDDDNDDEQ